MTESFLDRVRSAYPKAAPAIPEPGGSRRPFQGDITPYAAEALARETMNVSTAPEGTRNDTLNIAAVKLGALVAGGHLPAGEVVRELTLAATTAGLEESEIRKTLNSGLRKGETSPREIPDRDKELRQWIESLPGAPALPPESANGSTQAQTPTGGAPAPQNGTQPLPATAPNTPSMTPAPWETAPSADTLTTGAPSSSSPNPRRPEPAGSPSTSNPQDTPLPWEKQTPSSPSGATADILDVPAGLMARETAMEYLRQSARENAARLIKAQHTNVQAPRTWNLTEFLDTPDEPEDFRVRGLLPMGGRVILSAQYKAGKSSMVGNLARSLADGTPFLDAYAVDAVKKTTIIDNELSTRQLRRWYRDQNITHTDAVDIIPLRGAAATFDILDPVIRQQWAKRLAGTDFLILDCLRPVMDALGLSEDKDAGKFLAAFDALLEECGAGEAVIVHHMGHAGNRSRGDSRLLDWPDATWTLKREDPEDPKSPRFFEALGRDVNVDESLLDWNDETRELKIIGGSRREVRTTGIQDKILDHLRTYPHSSAREIEAMLRGKGASNATIRTALTELTERGEILCLPRIGKRGGGSEYVIQTKPEF